MTARATAPLVLTSFTATSCIGRGSAQTLAALCERRSGLRPCDFETVDLRTYVGIVDGVDATVLPAEWSRYDCRNNRLAELALCEDGLDADVLRAAGRYGRHRVGVFLGTSTSGILQTELAYRRRDPATGALPEDFDYGATQNSFSVVDFVRRRLRLEGPAAAVSAACASSAKVFAMRRRMIEAGLIDAALVGGVDSLCLTTLYGFHSLQLLAPGPCRPFDVARDGLSIGEAAAFALIERAPDESGCATRCCSSAPANRAMRITCRRRIRKAAARARAMQRRARRRRARRRRDRLHQSARHRNAEQRPRGGPGRHARVRRRDSRAARPRARPATRSAPPGRIEAVICALCLRDGLHARRRAHAQRRSGSSALHYLTREPAGARCARVLSNSFGFGGANCSLIFGRAG